MRAAWNAFLDLVLPRVCAGCRADPPGDAALCRRCSAKLPWLLQAPLTEPPSGLDACVAAVEFAGDVEPWIRRFKYPEPGLAGLNPAPAAVVGWLVLIAGRLAPGDPPDLVLPIPLHRNRLRSRGFNPAGELARSLAREHHATFDPIALERIRDTPSQTGLDKRGRRRNVAGAFEPRLGAHFPQTVWLVDDVVTTGSTLSEAARALRRAGAKHVVGVCVARTP
ncbi:MAG: ComF family protein [Myxococcales bacterium]|nr:ComF family protein [Myxococcales bacterium]